MITGAAGFIGGALTSLLRQRGITVHPLDDLSVPSLLPSPPGLDRRDVRALHSTDLDSVDTIVHLAARKSVPGSFADPSALSHNLSVDHHILRTFAGSRARRLLMASTCEVYGDRPGPLAETCQCVPRSPYATGKTASELLAAVYRPLLNAYQQIGVVRFFNIFGPAEGADAVVPAFLDAAAHDGQLTIEGDGTQSRDLTHIDDAMLMIQRILDEPNLASVVNLGSGRTITVHQIAESVLELTGRGKIVHAPARTNEIRSFTADMRLFTDTYGHVPALSWEHALAQTYRERARLRDLVGTPCDTPAPNGLHARSSLREVRP
ncbi:NAD(P)-dependent oxidoreductase [Nocardiopsis sp. YSL2]|uniref:NAD-dependent epimerase/dehydratase family protein n=1 Tax=Nocardiopsis sp. YSL2 TaxID=2939492 RepID=UPI0026F43319|nr:NAD-dependent epimerase/dehydratase family protein [Nocardiopsis sp. YSL2]